LLLEHGANSFIPRSDGALAEDIARKGGFAEVADLVAAAMRTTRDTSEVQVFSLDPKNGYAPRVDAAAVASMDEGMQAILAMYALQAGAGCSGHDEAGLKCALTRELGLRAQCSNYHVDISPAMVLGRDASTWQLFRGAARGCAQIKSVGGQLLHAPDTATFQDIWTRIAIARHGNAVRVTATAEAVV